MTRMPMIGGPGFGAAWAGWLCVWVGAGLGVVDGGGAWARAATAPRDAARPAAPRTLTRKRLGSLTDRLGFPDGNGQAVLTDADLDALDTLVASRDQQLGHGILD